MAERPAAPDSAPSPLMRSTLAAVLAMWNGAGLEHLEELLDPGYRGHVLGAPGGERVAAGYADVIRRFRAANAGVSFRVVEQLDAGDRCVSRLEATRPGADGQAVSHGMNISRFNDAGRLLEEWAIWSGWQEATPPEDRSA